MRRVPRVYDLRQYGLNEGEPRSVFMGRAGSFESPSRFNLPHTRGQFASRLHSAMRRGDYDVPVLPPQNVEQDITLTAFRRLSDSQPIEEPFVEPIGESFGDPIGEPSKPYVEDWESIGDDYKKSFLKTHSNFLKEKGYDFISIIGRGGYGEVWLVEQKIDENREGRTGPNKQRIACKIVSLNRLKLKGYNFKKAIKSLIAESEIYSLLNHPNIVKRIEIFHLKDEKSEFSQPIHVLMFMELMEGNLLSLIYNNNKQRLNEKDTIFWLRQVVSGLWYLHDKNISHLDLKPQNILYITFKESGVVRHIFKLTDFGVSAKFEPDEENLIEGRFGTEGYMAPEMSAGEISYTKPIDIYSLGIIMADSIAGKIFSTNYIISCAQDYENRVETMNQAIKFSPQFAELLAMMVRHEPEERPNISQVRDYLRKHFPDYYESYHGVTRL